MDDTARARDTAPALLIIDVQEAFDDGDRGQRNNPDAEANIARLLAAWRGTERTVIHVRHLNLTPGSPFHPDASGSRIKVCARPLEGEPVIEKTVNSAFIGTDLERRLRQDHIAAVVLAGLTTNHCVETTARMAGNLGFDTYVVSDATATFDRVGPDGVRHAADDIQRMTLSNLNDEFATIVTTPEAIHLVEDSVWSGAGAASVTPVAAAPGSLSVEQRHVGVRPSVRHAQTSALARPDRGEAIGMDTNTMIDALYASGPHPDLADRLMLFGQFVGAWDVDVTNYGPDGTPTHVPGEWHFGWALEGRAVMDVWIAPRRSLRVVPAPGDYGVSVRFFDPTIDAWRSTWLGPFKRVVKPFIARQSGDTIVLEGRFDGGRREQWLFSDITPTAFRWRYVASDDGGATWTTVQEMAAHRASRAGSLER